MDGFTAGDERVREHNSTSLGRERCEERIEVILGLEMSQMWWL